MKGAGRIGRSGAHRASTRRPEDTMKITRSSIATMTAPADWFTGSVHVDAIAAPGDGARISASAVHFAPGAMVIVQMATSLSARAAHEFGGGGKACSPSS